MMLVNVGLFGFLLFVDFALFFVWFVVIFLVFDNYIYIYIFNIIELYVH